MPPPDGYSKLANSSDENPLGHIWDHELRTMILNAVNATEPYIRDILLQPDRNVVNAIATPINHLGGEGVLVTLRNITEYRNIENIGNTEHIEHIEHIEHTEQTEHIEHFF